METHELPFSEERWMAVRERDTSQAGQFVFAVRSTRIFCSPGCPARTPRPGQVIFFDTPQAALQAGFRPCKRCQPEFHGGGQVALAARVCALLDTAERTLTLAELGQALATSPYHLQRSFKAVMGISPRQYAAALRLERFKQASRQLESVNQAIFRAGYGSLSRLYEKSAQRLGMSPGRYASGGNKMMIYYTIVPSALGRMLVAATPHGIAGLALSDEDADLQAFLLSEFPGAELVQADERLAGWVIPIQAYLDGTRFDPSSLLALPLDVRATAFQAHVWVALRQIPAGETRTYSDVAQGLGQPNAVRAVARACATNPVSLLTPCHRVVRRDGGLAGYRWGLARKKALLSLEREAVEPRK
jgi:AraC family transcriptional regulator of adaptative response/methylated-DNA-[protein]-cysteine methyltransferase